MVVAVVSRLKWPAATVTQHSPTGGRQILGSGDRSRRSRLIWYWFLPCVACALWRLLWCLHDNAALEAFTSPSWRLRTSSLAGSEGLSSSSRAIRVSCHAESTGTAADVPPSLPLPSWRQPPWEQRFGEMILPAARIVASTGTLGSGIVISSGPNGTYVLTNHHVVRDNIQQSDRWDPVAKSSNKVERLLPVKVEMFKYDERGRHTQTVTTLSEIVAYTPYGDRWDFEGDLAVLKLRSPIDGDPAAAVISAEAFDDEVRALDEIVMVGCPDGSDLPIPTTGHVASLSQERAGVGLILSQVFGNPGSSGSPVFRYSPDRNVFEVIAIHSMIDRRGGFYEDGGGRSGFLRVAVPAPVLHTFLRNHDLQHLVLPEAEPEPEQSEEDTEEVPVPEDLGNNASEASSENTSSTNTSAGNSSGASDADQAPSEDPPATGGSES